MFTLSLTLFGAIIPGKSVNSSQSQGTQGTLTFLSHLAGCTKGRAITVSWEVTQGVNWRAPGLLAQPQGSVGHWDC